MSLGGVAARGAKVTLIGQWAKFSIQMLSTVLLARILAPEDFGTYAMVAAISGFAMVLGDFGLSGAAIQAKEVSKAQQSNLFWLNVLVGFVVYAAIYLLADPIAHFYGRDDIATIIRVVSLTFLILAATTQFQANVTRSLKFKHLAASDITAQFCGFVCALVLGLLGFGVWALVLQQLVAAAVSLVFIGISSRWFPSLPRRAPMRSLLVFGANSFGVQTVNYVSGNIDSVLLGRFAGAATLGQYDRAYQLFRLPMQQIVAPMTRVALPILSRHQDDRVTMARYLRMAQLFITYTLGAVFLVAAALSAPLIAIALGPGWDESADIFTILAAGGAFQSMGYVYFWAFMATGLTGLQFRFSLITRAIMVALIAGGVFFGAIGVAAGVALGLFLNWLILGIFPMRRTGVDVWSLIIVAARPLAIHAVVFTAVILTDRFVFVDLLDILRVLLGLLVAGIGYGLAWLLIRAVRRDLADLVSMARKAI